MRARGVVGGGHYRRRGRGRRRRSKGAGRARKLRSGRDLGSASGFFARRGLCTSPRQLDGRGLGAPPEHFARRRLGVTDDSEQESSDVEQSVVRAVGESIDQIERDPDARRAIIRAYAQMEHAFDDAGVPRRPHEAPFEYLGRALRGVRVSPPAAGRLASLFERARFSQHAVAAETKNDAIGALREVERQIQAPPP